MDHLYSHEERQRADEFSTYSNEWVWNFEEMKLYSSKPNIYYYMKWDDRNNCMLYSCMNKLNFLKDDYEDEGVNHAFKNYIAEIILLGG